MEIETPWDFVAKFYPDYHGSDEIAHNDDLAKLVDRENEAGDCSDDLLKEDYGGNINNPRILIDYNASLVKIYEAAIEEAINSGIL